MTHLNFALGTHEVKKCKFLLISYTLESAGFEYWIGETGGFTFLPVMLDIIAIILITYIFRISLMIFQYLVSRKMFENYLKMD